VTLRGPSLSGNKASNQFHLKKVKKLLEKLLKSMQCNVRVCDIVLEQNVVLKQNEMA